MSLGNRTTFLRIISNLVSGNVLFASDGAYDVGEAAASRPRDLYTSRNVAMGGALAAVGNVMAGAAAALGFTGRARFASSADGALAATNAAGTAAATMAAAMPPIVVTEGVGSPRVLTDLESGSLVTNEGAGATAYATLPAARAGLVFTFVRQSATQNLLVAAAAGDTIRQATGVTPAAGTATTAAQGDVGIFWCLNATEWVILGNPWTLST